MSTGKMMTSLRLGEDGSIEIIDQLLLPHVIEWVPVKTIEDAFDAIKSMRIRGAPAIASLAALTVAYVLRQALESKSGETAPSATAYSVPNLHDADPAAVRSWLAPALDYLQSSRPTAVNLSAAMNRIRAAGGLSGAAESGSQGESGSAVEVAKKVVAACEAVHANDLERNKEMGRLGAEWLWARRKGGEGQKKLRVMTVCNTGSLATAGYGTALGVITSLFETGRLERAYYTQSTPYHQGSRLTSLELSTLQAPSCMICDTMVGSLFQHEQIDAVIVGADRVVRNGDTANKIGTYQAACLAKRHGIPFMVVAPVTTLDLSIETGAGIHIEQRPAIEATLVRGLVKRTSTAQAANAAALPDAPAAASVEQAVVQVTPNGIGSDEGKPWQMVYNPSFDVTPADLISCVVTEKGVAENEGGKEAIDLSKVC